jgi:Ring finger domain
MTLELQSNLSIRCKLSLHRMIPHRMMTLLRKVALTILSLWVSCICAVHARSDVDRRSIAARVTLSHRDLNEANEVAKNAIIFLLGGIALVGGLMLLTYLITIVMDKITGTTSTSVTLAAAAAHRAALDAQTAMMLQQQINGDGSLGNDFDRGSISRKANLWGLRLYERELILQKVFPTMVFDFNLDEFSIDKEKIPEVESTFEGDIEMASMSRVNSPNDDSEEQETKEGESCSVVKETVSVATGEIPQEGTTTEQIAETVATDNDQRTATDDHDENILENALKNVKDHYRMCCICLVPYENGVCVMTGTQCQHMFHDTCCQQWLLQHDHCPYCRKEMISSIDFRSAAINTLGSDRIEELSVMTMPPNPTPFSIVPPSNP